MDLPRHNIPKIIETRTRLVETVFPPYYGVPLTGDCLDSMVQDLRAALPGKIPYAALFETVRGLAGKELDAGQLAVFAWRVAGNIRKLQAGHPVYPWTHQAKDEWVPFQVIRGVVTRGRYNKIGVYFDFRALAGTLCPTQVSRFWSTSACGFAAREMGFSRSDGKYPYTVGEQLVGLRFYGLVEAERSRGEPWFQEVRCPGGFVKWNRDILNVRLRHKPCPFEWTHACHQCVIGYEIVRDEAGNIQPACDAATHPKNYVSVFCNDCGETAYRDPEHDEDLCVRCARKKRLQRQTT